jgi:hypothetical protein
MAIMAMRNTTYSIQMSVYVPYLKQVGLVGTTIGILFGAAEIASATGVLFAGRAMRLGDAQRTTLSGSALTIPELSLRPPRSPRHGLKVPRAHPERCREIEFLPVKADFGPSSKVVST